MTKQAGFSLVEILIAISITALLGTVVGIALNDLPTKGR
jgi:prepilin-type N-terminal cleavage/methylation domain-containing protein